MKKQILVHAIVAILSLPCLLIFTEGEDGGMTIYNLIGIAYLALTVLLLNHLPKSVKDEFNKMVREE